MDKETPTDAEIAKKVITDLIARLEKRISENGLRRMLTALNTNQNP